MSKKEETTQENKSDEQINLLEYIYEDGQMVEIPGRLLEGLMQVLRAVEKDQRHDVFIDNYPTAPKEEYDRDGLLEEVKTKWTPYPTAKSFFAQEPQTAITTIGMMALDQLMFLQNIHLSNIKENKAQKIGSIKKDKKNAADIKLV